MFGVIGSLGDRKSAKIAMKTSMIIIRPPTIAILFLRNLRQTSAL